MIKVKKLSIAVLAGAMVFAGAVVAQAQEVKMHTFTVEPQISYITYKEPVMKETGVFYGLMGSYTYRGELFTGAENAMLKAEGRLSFGRVDYDGQLSNGTPYKIDGINDLLFETRGLAGYDFNVFSSTTITPFTGLGYRFLSDNLSTDPAGYRRFANYLYSPIGFETKTPFGDGWSAGVNLEYDMFWFGRQYSYLSDFNSSYDDLTNDQDKGYGIRASFKVAKQSADFNLSVEPYLIYWDIDKSKVSNVTVSGTVVGYGYEPENTSTEIGAKVGFEF
jgi:hypothetical protein